MHGRHYSCRHPPASRFKMGCIGRINRKDTIYDRWVLTVWQYKQKSTSIKLPEVWVPWQMSHAEIKKIQNVWHRQASARFSACRPDAILLPRLYTISLPMFLPFLFSGQHKMNPMQFCTWSAPYLAGGLTLRHFTNKHTQWLLHVPLMMRPASVAPAWTQGPGFPPR